MSSVWLLNLDADHELARPLGYTPTRSVLQRVNGLRPAVRRFLFEPGDVELWPEEPTPAEARGRAGRAWCMTPRARRLLEQAGAVPIAAPDLETLQRVNAREFAFTLCEREGPSICSAEPADLEHFMEQREPGTNWLAKRAHGMAGRSQRRLRAGSLVEADRSWIAKAAREGAILIEPLRALELECIVHGDLGATGELRLGPVLEQLCTPEGAWIANRADAALPTAERECLLAAAEHAGRALAAAGYFGPFGLDSYAWLEGGERHWNALSDLNARYTMGWQRPS